MPENLSAFPEAGDSEIRDFSCSRLFDEVPCYISVQNRDLRVIKANRKILQDFGDGVSRYCFSVYKGRSSPCPECPVVRTFEDGREHTSEEMIFDRHGLPHDVIVNTKPLRNDGGQIVAVMELFSDITVQKELEHRLHESLVRFHHLFDTVPCFISVQDRDLRIMDANSPFIEAFGDGTGRHCYEVYKHRQDRCPECPVAETFRDGEVHHSEEVVVDNAGRKVHVLVYTAPVRDSLGKIVSVMEVSTDITEIRALQDKLASLGKLVAGTAHGVKNILEGLRGGVYIVNLGFRDNNQQNVRTGWEMVERNVGRLSAMIMDMLYCSKDRVPARAPVSLCAAAREAAELFSARAADAGVELVSEISESDVIIAGEQRDLHSLIANLLTNAIDACSADQDGEKRHRIALRVFSDGRDAVVQVQDTGPGMDEETRNKLFGMLYSTKGSHGTGLGLLVSHKVATEHGGTIEVDSAPGEGSTFTVRFSPPGSH